MLVLEYLRHYSNLEKIGSSDLISIVLHLELLIIIPMMRSMNYFNQVILEIMESNELKTFFGNSEFCPHFLKFLEGEN